MNHRQVSDRRIRRSLPLSRIADEDEDLLLREVPGVGSAQWKVAQVWMAAFAGALTGAFFGGIIGAAVGSFFSRLDALEFGVRGVFLGAALGALLFAWLTLRDPS